MLISTSQYRFTYLLQKILISKNMHHPMTHPIVDITVHFLSDVFFSQMCHQCVRILNIIICCSDSSICFADGVIINMLFNMLFMLSSMLSNMLSQYVSPNLTQIMFFPIYQMLKLRYFKLIYTEYKLNSNCHQAMDFLSCLTGESSPVIQSRIPFYLDTPLNP